MKIIQFYDGKNFYTSLRSFEESSGQRLSIHYDSFAAWLVAEIGGGIFAGAHYYTGVPSTLEDEGENRDDGLLRFLSILERKRGFFIHRLERIERTRYCPHCHETMHSWEEKGIEIRMACDMIQLAAAGAFDAAILLSGDVQMHPVLETLRRMGKIVYLAGWEEHTASRKLRSAAFDFVDLSRGAESFAQRAGRSPAENGNRRDAVENADRDPDEDDGHLQEDASFVAALRAAQDHFEPRGYVGVHYFLNDWKDSRLPQDPGERRDLLEDLLEQNLVEIYVARDGKKALRTV